MQKTVNENLEATTHSFEGATKVTQEIARQIAGYSKRSFEQGTKTVENLLGARSLDNAVEVQAEYARSAYEDYLVVLPCLACGLMLCAYAVAQCSLCGRGKNNIKNNLQSDEMRPVDSTAAFRSCQLSNVPL